jgi:plastocyanin
MAAHTITIHVTPAGVVVPSSTEVNFTYSPSTIRVSPGDTVQWTSPDGPFVVMFTEGTPIANTQLAPPGLVIDAHSVVSGPPAWSTLTFTVPAGALGHFHYAVALALLSSAGQATVHIDAGCPEILAN